MQYSIAYIFLIFLAFCDASTQRKKKSATQTLARGWGDDITWVQTYEEGLTKMKESKKPLMVIHHLEDCPHSKALKKAFSEHQTIQQLAKKDFVMVNLVHETADENLAPDGFYAPRILFVDPSMTVRADIVGKYTNRMYTYEPADMDILVDNMRKALTLLKGEHEKHGDL